MKKIKFFTAVVITTSLLGFTSFAAVTTLNNGAQTIASDDIITPLNNNAAILDEHISKIAGTDVLGHIKIGTGLQLMEDGVANVKIANDLETDETETALSAAQGKELNDNITALSNDLTWQDCEITLVGDTTGAIDGVINGTELKISAGVKINSTGWVTIGKIPSDVNICKENSVGQWRFTTVKDSSSISGTGIVMFDNTISIYVLEAGSYYFTVDVPLAN